MAHSTTLTDTLVETDAASRGETKPIVRMSANLNLKPVGERKSIIPDQAVRSVLAQNLELLLFPPLFLSNATRRLQGCAI